LRQSILKQTPNRFKPPNKYTKVMKKKTRSLKNLIDTDTKNRSICMFLAARKCYGLVKLRTCLAVGGALATIDSEIATVTVSSEVGLRVGLGAGANDTVGSFDGELVVDGTGDGLFDGAAEGFLVAIIVIMEPPSMST